jgi:hypothetical protein
MDFVNSFHLATYIEPPKSTSGQMHIPKSNCSRAVTVRLLVTIPLKPEALGIHTQSSGKLFKDSSANQGRERERE